MAMYDSADADQIEPTSTNFSDIVVLSNRATWTVDVFATAFTFTDNVATDGVAVPEFGLAVTDISVAITGANALATLEGDFSLSIAPQDIASGTRTQGWTSLGIDGAGYAIAVDGDEAPGTYQTTVTYTITAP
jgi:hypothetical protein